jgi:hypothetical protein
LGRWPKTLGWRLTKTWPKHPWRRLLLVRREGGTHHGRRLWARYARWAESHPWGWKGPLVKQALLHLLLHHLQDLLLQLLLL